MFKVARILLLFKHAHVQLFRLIHPRAIRLVKLGNIPVDREVMQAILGFFALFMGIFVFASLLMAASGMDIVSAGAAVIARSDFSPLPRMGDAPSGSIRRKPL